MADVERLIVALEARTKAFETAMNKANGVANSRATAIERRFQAMNANINRSFQSMLKGGAAMLGVGLGVREIQQMADAWTDMSSRVGLAVGSMDLAPQVMQRIYDMAQRTYSGLNQTAEAFLGNAAALRELGYSTNEQLDFTEALNNALVVSGAKAERAASVNNALSKAMALGTLQGENLNTVIQTGGRVAELLAAQLGVGVNQLRGLGKEGKITGDVIYKALTGNLQKLREEAESMPATISDGFQLLQNALTKFIGTMDQAHGVTGTIAQGLVYVANNFESVATGAAAAAAVLLGRYVPSLVRTAIAQGAVVATNPWLLLATVIGAAAFALSAFGGEIQPVAGEMANLHDYAGAVWDMIANGVTVAASAISDTMLGAINLMVSAMDGVEVSWSDVLDFMKAAVNQIIGEFSLLYDEIVIVFTKLPAAIADGVIGAMNTMIGHVEAGINKVVEAVNTAIQAINSLGEWAGVGGIGTIGPVELGRIENSYAGAGQAAGEAYGEALRRAAQDHVGNALGALSSRANQRHRDRIAAQKDADLLSSDNPLDRHGPRLGGGGSGGGGGKGKKGGKGRADELQREIEKIKERTASLQAETAAQAQINPLIDDYDYAMTKARATQDLLNAAQKAGIAITPELRAKIDELAETYAQATVAANQLQESQENARQAAEEMRSLGKDVMGGFIRDLKAGKSLAESFAGALNKIADKLLDMGLNSLFDKGGFLGNLFGGLGSIFGFADGGIARNGKPVPLKRFARGGVSKSAAIFGEGPMAEAAVPLPDGRRIPVDLRVPQLSQGQGGGGVADVRVWVDENGNWQAAVEQISQRTAAQATRSGIAQYDRQAERALGGRIARAQARQM